MQWTWQTEGPVRFAPAIANGRVYAVSDDGHLYCLDAGDGRLIQKWRGGPDDEEEGLEEEDYLLQSELEGEDLYLCDRCGKRIEGVY